MLPAFFSAKHVEVSPMTKQAVLFEEQVEFSRVN